MPAGLLLPVFLLAGVAAGWMFVVTSARRQGELVRRIETVVKGRPLTPDRSRGASIRMQRTESAKLRMAAWLLKMPVDLPMAHVIPPPVIFGIGTALAIGAVWLGGYLISRPLSLGAGAVVWVVVIRGLFAWELGLYQAKLVRQLPDTIQLVISATRAGLPVSEAFRAIADDMPSPTRDEFVRVEREMAMGSQADEALLALHERTGVAEYAIFAVTIGVQARSGGRLAETIQNLADTVRERLAVSARAGALAGEAKLSAFFMCILPVIAGLFLSIVNPKHMSTLFHDPRGVRMLSIGVVTLVLGIATMRQMIWGATRD